MKANNFITINLTSKMGRILLSTIEDTRIDSELIHKFNIELMNIGGKLYWNLYNIYDEIIKALNHIGSREIIVNSIGIDAWGYDIASFHKDGSIDYMPRAYCDNFSDKIQNKFFNSIKEEDIYGRSGIHVSKYGSLYRMYGVKKEKSSIGKSHKIMFIPDALAYMLTGSCRCEYTMLASSGLMNIKNKVVDKKLASLCGLKRRRFASVIQPGKKIGVLNDYIASQTGLGKIAVVSVASYNTTSAVVSIPAEDEGFAYITAGSISHIGIESTEAISETALSLKGFDNNGAPEGKVCIQKSLPGMVALENGLSKDSLIEQYSEAIDTLKEIAPFRINRIYVSGKGAKDSELVNKLAAKTGIRVISWLQPASTLGNIGLQAIHMGLFKNIHEYRQYLRSTHHIEEITGEEGSY